MTFRPMVCLCLKQRCTPEILSLRSYVDNLLHQMLKKINDGSLKCAQKTSLPCTPPLTEQFQPRPPASIHISESIGAPFWFEHQVILDRKLRSLIISRKTLMMLHQRLANIYHQTSGKSAAHSFSEITVGKTRIIFWTAKFFNCVSSFVLYA